MMAKGKKVARPTEEEGEPRWQIDIDADLFRMIGKLAADAQVSRPTWLSNKIRPLVEAEFKAMLRRDNIED